LGAFLLISTVGCTPPAEEMQKEAAQPKAMEEKAAAKPKPAVQPAKGKPLALKFEQDQFGTYKTMSVVRKSYRFEQPTKKQKKEERSKTKTEVTFSQRITNVGEDGSALAEITIRGLKCYSAASGEVRLDFDSSREGSRSEPLARLLGQTYTVRLFPDGRVKFVDAARARTIVREGLAAGFANKILSERDIEKRHSIPAMWGRADSTVKVGQKWTDIEQGPKSMLQAKSYRKDYKITETWKEKGHENALVKMKATAVESAGEDGQVMDLFRQIFKGEDKYAGKGELVLDLDSGTVLRSSEELEATWMATDQEYVDDGSGPGPDLLVMGFMQEYSIEKID
jgi:hypothetical protein